MWKKIILAILFVTLSTGWIFIYFASGVISVISWWGMQLFSLFSLIILSISGSIIVRNVFCKRKVHKTIISIFILAIIGAWPVCWFGGIGQIAYPVDTHSTNPKVTVRFPLSQTAIVGWGGNEIETNYHAIAPNQRWAYDLLMMPAGMKHSNLEDYGIYGADVLAPASGTVVSIQNDEFDLKLGADDSNSMVGNHIYIRLDETGTYLVLAHLKKGSVRVKKGQHIKEGTVVANVGNSGNSSEPHLHIHHQRQDPSKTSIFLTEGLPLYFRGIQGPAAPKGGVRIERGKDVPVGDIITPLPL
ncbi:M23 family metallopeptidase [Bacillus cytotoxicus]|uniref:M23 family metallopeptidase n=1 Tax=Bacillus cereus group sp. BfR-BA-01492 TaxID=2920361 RepID=UPI001F59AAE9|nr:M23 family metallopeptidase [Bacillus cereus group sp. BfR-BA-01492]EMA6343205.1 M23 family metallopeptidase [Bacillus cytotoxicus]